MAHGRKRLSGRQEGRGTNTGMSGLPRLTQGRVLELLGAAEENTVRWPGFDAHSAAHVPTSFREETNMTQIGPPPRSHDPSEQTSQPEPRSAIKADLAALIARTQIAPTDTAGI